MERRPGFLTTIAAALLILATCGNDAVPPTDGGPTTDQGTSPTSGAPSTTSSSGPALVCETPPPAQIGLGSATTGAVSEDATSACYWVAVPEGLDSLSFELTGLTANLDVNVGYGFIDTVQYHYREFWRSSADDTSDEMLVIDHPAVGPYFIRVSLSGFDDFSPFELAVATTPGTTTPTTGGPPPDSAASCAAPAVEMALDSSIDSEVVGRDGTPHPRAYFCVQIPEGLSSFTVEVTGLEDNLDLEVWLVSANQQWGDRSRGGTERSVVVDNPAPGAYYLDVAAALSGASSKFTITVEGS